MSPVEPWTILLFSLYGVLQGQEMPSPSVSQCCQDGRTRARAGQDCTILPLISSSHTCRIIQEQCCSALQEDMLCTSGINMARKQEACETPFFHGEPWETQLSKLCCDCCMLGLTAARQGWSCEPEDLFLGKQCEHALQACCGKNATKEAQCPTKAPVTEKPSINDAAKPSEGTSNCGGSNCSQLCVGNGTCACRDGYQLKKDGMTCEDIDECSLGTHNCGPDFLCTNTAGSFRCYPKDGCPHGYIKDAGGSCIDINECLHHNSPCPGEECINTVGSYICRKRTITCERGYHLNEDGTWCEDVDECRTGDVCAGHDCENLVGTYRCKCKRGFTESSITGMCEDIDECRNYPGRLCAHKCENTVGSYHCSCTTGFKLARDRRNCEDVNECEAKPCSQECANVYGSYQCYCRRGYQLSDTDGITCEDIDECALPTGGHMCSYHCSNTPGSFLCSCPPTGYTLIPSRNACQDIDECAAGSHTCSVFESCFNILGGFRCLSMKCPQNYHQTAQGSRNDNSVTVHCIKACQNHEISCTSDPVHLITHTALSLPTFREFREPEEIVFLQTVVPANHLPGTDVFFSILTADDHFSFDVVKRSQHGMIMGVVRQVKPITGPKDLIVEVAMNYVASGLISHRNVVIVHIFISEFWF